MAMNGMIFATLVGEGLVGPWLSGVTNIKGNKMEQERDDGRSKTPLPELNLSRRRLVRSLTAAAPLVLTLRSGAVVAAVSCVGAKALDASTNGSGKITLNNGGSVALEDRCVIDYQVCPDPNQPTKILSGTVAGDPITANGPNFSCVGANNQNPVAILSSMSVTSLIARG